MEGRCYVRDKQQFAFTHNDASNHWSIPGIRRQRQPGIGVSEVNTVRFAREARDVESAKLASLRCGTLKP
jgi:hypothetical protein